MRERSFVQFAITATVETSPEEFLEKFNTLLIRDIGMYVHAINGNSAPLTVENFEITGIEKV